MVERSFASGIRGPDLRKLYQLVAEPRINPEENGFDVILATEAGQQYIDLTEAAPLHSAGGSYEKAALSYVMGERADAVFNELLKTSMGYGTAPRAVVHLLVYATDFRFFLDSSVLDLLAYRAIRGELCFASIVYYCRFSDDDNHLELIYPRSPTDFEGFDETGTRGRQVALGDLRTVRAIPNGVAIKISPPLHPLGRGPVTIVVRSKAVHLPDSSDTKESGNEIPPRESG